LSSVCGAIRPSVGGNSIGGKPLISYTALSVFEDGSAAPGVAEVAELRRGALLFKHFRTP
jgi:hypothetical protein